MRPFSSASTIILYPILQVEKSLHLIKHYRSRSTHNWTQHDSIDNDPICSAYYPIELWTRRWMSLIPVLDTRAGFHCLQLSSNRSNTSLNYLVQIYQWRFADQLFMSNPTKFSNSFFLKKIKQKSIFVIRLMMIVTILAIIDPLTCVVYANPRWGCVIHNMGSPTHGINPVYANPPRVYTY